MKLNYTEISLFKERSIVEYFNQIIDKIKSEVSSASKDKIEGNFISHLLSKYTISAPLVIDEDSREIEKLDSITKDRRDEFDQSYKEILRIYLVSYSFTGDPNLFSMWPTVRTFTSNSSGSKVFLSQVDGKIGVTYGLPELDTVAFEESIDADFKKLFSDNLTALNADIESLNRDISNAITQLVERKRIEIDEENDFLKRMNKKK